MERARLCGRLTRNESKMNYHKKIFQSTDNNKNEMSSQIPNKKAKEDHTSRAPNPFSQQIATI
ncbi:hypothetical protein DV515_00003048 [Chloebia gouldiae]|uniref:Uncharacterized protein n=1 Tax=Chloebia gouldiae TaxID=44316 RepID=A0A3L8SUC4_CHLGU|nr:hypothetical protein DV515_00003048 [Chloebia gouldiae]